MPEKHIILFTPSVFTGGGTERVLTDLANMLQQEGWHVTILSSISGTKKLYPLNKEIPVHVFPFASFRDRHSGSIPVKILNKLLGKFLLTRFLQQQVRNETKAILSFSADITHDCFKTRFGNRVMAFEHFPFEAYNNNPKAQQQIRKYYPQLRNVIVLTTHQENRYKEMGCSVVRIPNTYSFCPPAPAALTNKIVISVGHLSNIKRRDLLITAWKKVAAACPDWQLHIIGEGPEQKQLEQQINELQLSEQVKLLPPTSAIEAHYKNASLFVLTSAFESFSLVLLEAKVSGLPCVSYDVVCGPNELIREGVDGFLVPFGDTEMLAGRIIQLIGDEELRQSMGQKAREDAINRFHPSLIKQQWLSMLQNI
jgi:glycosyltransferase involved in cell wall biosynthesis